MPSMLDDRTSGDRATTTAAPESVPGAAAATTARRGEGVKVGRRSRFVQGVFSLKLLNKNKLMASPTAGAGEGRGGEPYRRTFEEEHSCKQPLLVKNQSYAAAGGGPTSRANFSGGVSGGFNGDARRSVSWKAPDGAEKAEQERYDAAEARGYGLYSLHAVIGQGTFGRIHLASWQHRGSGVDATSATAAAAPTAGSGDPAAVLPSSPRSLSIEGPSSRGPGAGGDTFRAAAAGGGGAVMGGTGAGGATTREARGSGSNPTSAPGSIIGAVASKASSLPGTLATGFRGALRGGVGRAGAREAVAQHRDGSRLYFYPPTGSRRSAGRTITSSSFGWEMRQHHRSRFSEEGGGWRDGDGGGWGGGFEPLRLRALKSVCKRRVTEKGLVRHMETELAVLKQCRHPFIVSLSPGGQFQTSGHLHLVLNYCPGGDLFSLLGRVGRLPEQQVRVCAAQLALALQHLHGKHIAYRDLKPDNVCIDARGHAILVDFSLARTGLDTAPDGKAYTFCGSAAYAAPEIIRKEGHDTRVDLWSLGCVVFEALVGEHPFRRPRGEKMDRQALFERIQLGRLDYPSSLSASAVSLLRGLLSVNPDDRPGFFFSQSPPSRTLPPPPPSPGQQQRTSAESVTPAAATTTTAPTDSEWRPLEHTPASTPPMPRPVPASPDRRSPVNNGETENSSGGVQGVTAAPAAPVAPATVTAGEDETPTVDSKTEAGKLGDTPLKLQRRGPPAPVRSTAQSFRPGAAGAGREPPRRLLLEHVFFRGLPGWGGPGTGGAWEDAELEGVAVAVPALFDPLDVRHFDSRFTTQAVELSLQGHPHKGGPTPAFEGFEWRDDNCIEYAQPEDRRASSLFESLASALWC